MSIEWERVPSKRGPDTLRVRRQGRQIYLHSAYDPLREAREWASKVEKPSQSNIVAVFGLGLGYHLRALLEMLPSGQRVIVVEPHEGIREAFELDSLQADFSQHRSVVVVGGWSEFKEVYVNLGGGLDNVLLLRLPAAAQVFEPEYLEFLEKLRSEMKMLRSNVATVLNFTPLWQHNFIKNLRFANEVGTVAPLFGRWSERPAILAAAGPSLAKNVDLLRQAKGRALIISVGSATRLLLKKGIEPDFVVTFDAGEPNYECVFKGVELPETPIIFDPINYYKILEEHQGPKVMMCVHPSNQWLDHYFDQEVGQVKVGGSVACTVFDMLRKAGADPIILIGQDLAFTDDQMHAEGSLETIDVVGRKAEQLEEVQASSRQRYKKSDQTLVWVEGNDGKPIATNVQMETYIHWFEEEIRVHRDSVRVINATEGGARIRGAETMPLRKALQDFAQDDLSSELGKVRQRLLGDPGFDSEAFLADVRRVRRQAEAGLPSAHKGVQLSERLLRHFVEGASCPLEKLVAKLGRIDKKLKAARKDAPLISYALAPLSILRRYALEGDDQVAACRSSIQMYRTIAQAFELSLPLLRELERELEAGSEESAQAEAAPQAEGCLAAN